jgi:acyl-coenzyme A synthetase/AMP-(fatty) acid ligase
MAGDPLEIEPFPREHLQIPIPELIDAAAVSAEREAIGTDMSFTYREASDLIDRIAHAVLESGVAHGDRVILLFDHRAAAFCGDS